MFDRIKRLFGRKPTPAPTVAWEKPNTTSAPPSGRAAAPPPPPMASSRLQETMTASRSRSAAVMGPPSTESVMAAKRQQTAAAVPPPPPTAGQRERSLASITPPANAATDNRRVVKSMHKGERTNAKEFMGHATVEGQRDLRHAKAREVKLKTKEGMKDGINLLHRTGSVTELHLNQGESSVASAKHHSKTTGQTFEVRENKMRGSAKRQLDKIARKHDHRD